MKKYKSRLSLNIISTTLYYSLEKKSLQFKIRSSEGVLVAQSPNLFGPLCRVTIEVTNSKRRSL